VEQFSVLLGYHKLRKALSVTKPTRAKASLSFKIIFINPHIILEEITESMIRSRQWIHDNVSSFI
jgi:hypothetical protein